MRAYEGDGMVGMGTSVMSLPLSSGLLLIESSVLDVCVGSWMTKAFIVDGSGELMVAARSSCRIGKKNWADECECFFRSCRERSSWH